MPTKVCAHCSVQTQTAGAFCPNCGKPFVRARQRWSTRRKVTIGLVIAVVLVAGAGTIVGINAVNAHNSEVAQAAADAQAAKEAKDAADAAALKASQQKAADDKERASRLVDVKAMEASITSDAQKRVDTGVLEGPISATSCTPLGGGSTDDLTAITTTFTCIAINKTNDDGTQSGYQFSSTMNWNTGSYTWHLGG